MLNNSSIARINKELCRDFSSITYNCVLYHPNKRYIEINITSDNNDIQFNIYPDYPFKSPKLLVNGKCYITRHVNMYHKYNKILNILNYHKECPCCDTILCNWSPANTLYQLFEEYKNREIKYNKIKLVLTLNILKSQLPFDDYLHNKIISYA